MGARAIRMPHPLLPPQSMFTPRNPRMASCSEPTPDFSSSSRTRYCPRPVRRRRSKSTNRGIGGRGAMIATPGRDWLAARPALDESSSITFDRRSPWVSATATRRTGKPTLRTTKRTMPGGSSPKLKCPSESVTTLRPPPTCTTSAPGTADFELASMIVPVTCALPACAAATRSGVTATETIKQIVQARDVMGVDARKAEGCGPGSFSVPWRQLPREQSSRKSLIAQGLHRPGG